MRSLTPNIRDLHAPGAVEAEHVLNMLHEHESNLEDQDWRAKIFSTFPRRFAYRLAREYEEIYTFENRCNANLYLLGHWERSKKRNIPLSSNDCELEQLSKKYAAEMRQIGSIIHDDVDAVVRLWRLAKSYGIKPPDIYDPNITPGGILRRLWDDQWWLRQLRKAHAKNLEEEAILLGFVHEHAGLYISDESFSRYQDQKIRNRRIISRLIAVNEQYQAFKLEDLIAKGTSNPINRRNELMCRVCGFETIANDLGHIADFLTLSCPSRMHPRHNKSGKNNVKYDGTTPSQAQKYLTTTWARIRAQLKRDGLEIYGFRIAEPHHDGTPHWHLLVFYDKSNMQKIRDIFIYYALQVDGDEKGAKKHRLKVEPIDKTKGSAIGYIAKYISKNIDGYAIDKDENGLDAKNSADRVTAWASTWGIRQFQQFGGVPVTIWRELRRATAQTPAGILTEAYEAADAGDWAKFLMTLGGPAPMRKNLPIQLAKIESQDIGKYGDPMGKKTIGLVANSITLPTRIHQWSITTVKALAENLRVQMADGNLIAAEPQDGGTAARASAQCTDICGEAALEYCH